MKFCSSVVAEASFSKLLEYEQIENGLPRYLLLEKVKNTILYRKNGGPVPPDSLDFDTPANSYLVLPFKF